MSQSYRWIFVQQLTEQNVEEHRVRLVAILKTIAKKWVFQLEQGTHLHFQGRMSLRKKMSFDSLSKLMQCHIQEEKAEWTVSTMYCMKKDATFRNGPWTDVSPNDIIEDYVPRFPVWVRWQQQLLDIVDATPSRRTIYYVWSEHGRTGKSTLVQYLRWEKRAVFFSIQSSRHITHAVVEAGPRKIYVFDLPRSAVDLKTLRDVFMAIEDIKNGIVRSGMYEAKELFMRPPHVIIFANLPPPPWLSIDRYRVCHVTQQIPSHLCIEDQNSDMVLPFDSTDATSVQEETQLQQEALQERLQEAAFHEEGQGCHDQHRGEEASQPLSSQ